MTIYLNNKKMLAVYRYVEELSGYRTVGYILGREGFSSEMSILQFLLYKLIFIIGLV